MNTLNMIKKNIIVELNDILVFAAIPLAGGLFGMIISTIIYFSSGREFYMELSSFMVLIVGVFVLLFGVAFSERNSFTLAVTMGVTRKNYFLSRYVVLLLQIILTLAAMALMIGIDKFMFPGAEHESMFDVFKVSPVTLIVVCLIFPVFSMFMGMLYVRFERKFFWAVWALWMLGSLGIPRALSAMGERPDSTIAKIGFFFEDLITASDWKLGVTGVVVLAIVLFFTVKLYKTQPITA
ncbi:MAG: hypothetical protein J6U15_02270 [Lachnospiraceae bacterium]|nr:hypothetical protein [Lachnospiraceae bacterium]